MRYPVLAKLSIAVLVATVVFCTGSSDSGTPDSQPLAAPEEVKILSTAPLPPAIGLVDQIITDPYSSEPRLELASLYRAQGFPAAAQFYATTVAVLEGRDATFNPPGQSGSWFYHERSGGSFADDVMASSQARELSMGGEPEEAVAALERRIDEVGLSTVLAGSWAYNVLLLRVLRGEVAKDQLEPALRLYFTVVEETPISPTGSTWDDYKMLGALLEGSGDPVSAYVAASLAASYLQRDVSASTRVSSGSRQMLTDQLRTLSETLEDQLGSPPPDVTLE